MADLNDLADYLDKLSASINKQASDFSVKVATQIITDLVFHTPVDTSQALSNWIPTLNTPAVGTIAPFVPGMKGSSQLASAAEVIAQATKVWASKQPGQPIFITNNLPYIVRLNDGYSAQQPAGFVERATLIGRQLLTSFTLSNA